ncbi:pesticin receptor [Candidatus Phycosocius bacilliformis]|uniref:Pesticin receptor n=1 Tax=Candidatus Phycosocius bacilliformis TaxID=1445552 RepID=A0A2P2E9W8_9PROT|nr:TonB-dependent receptor [Candidatus Phycosocius bacilliformis]GBF57834.1 pesticin receptor [Candidatus Phycosocius bacilliformis]
MKMNRLGYRGLLLAACATSIYAAPAFAQQQAPAAAEEQPVEEVIVTATRRETALQSVAVAVTAIGAEAIQSAGVKDIRDLTQLAPSLQVPVSENSGSVTARIRGVGTQGSNPGLESSVGVVIDGVFRARNSVAFGDLGEIRAIEVLRGPQGTLFGRNTSAGLINVTTKKPSFEFGTSGDATFGNYGLGGIGLGITGPLIEDKLAGRLYVTARARDGYMNVNNGTARTESNDTNYYAVRGQLLYTPSETFDARLIVDVASRAEACCAAAVWLRDVRVPSTTDIINKISPNGLQTSRNLNSYLASANRTYDQDIDDQGFSLEANWDVGFGKLTSITAKRNWKRVAGADSDYTGADILYSLKSEGAGAEFDTFSQEFRYAGTVGKLDWLVGTIYAKETLNNHVRFRTGNDYQAYIGALLGPALALASPSLAVNPLNPAVTNTQLAGVVSTWQSILGVTPANIGTLAGGGGQFDDYVQESESLALFTHNIYQFNDDFSVTLGLRYTSEDKNFRASYRTLGNTGCTAIENRLGLDAARNAGALAGVVGAICAPWMRSALDGMDHRQKKSENEWSGIVSAAYRFAPNINSYVSYSRGYKAGGFNLDRAFSDLQNNLVTSIVSPGVGNRTVRQPDTSFAAETVDAYEVGLKTQWFNRALTANFAAYHQTFENFQLNTFTGISFVVTAVPEVVSQGVEFDYVLRTPVDGLTLTGGAAYSLTEYTKNLGAASQPSTFLGQNPNLYLLPGAQLTSSPVWTYGSALNYERSVLSDKALFKAYADFRTITDTITGSNLDPRKTQPGYTLFNARLALSTADERWTVELWGRNLTDERYAQITFDAPLQGDAPALTNQPAVGGFAPRPINSQINAFVGEPRTYGLTLRWSY